MIKINLLRNMGLDQAGAAAFGGGAGSIPDEVKKTAAMKVGLIIVLPLLVNIYERFSLSTIESDIKTTQQSVSQLEAQIASFGETAPRVEKYTKEKAKIEKEIESIRALTRNRLREVKSFDALQSAVPSATWIREISIEGNTVRLTGYSQSQDGINEFVAALENSVFSRIEPRGTARVELPTGPAMSFELEFRVGKE